MSAILIGLVATCLAAAPQPRHLSECVPADVMAVYFGQPGSENVCSDGTLRQLTGWVITLKAMGVIPKEGRVIADIIGSLPLLGRCPHAAMLLDITAREISPGSYRLNTMQAAVVLESRGADVEIDRRVRDLLATYTDADSGRLETVDDGGRTHYRLADQRLPEWAVVEWGSIDERFLVAFGAGAFERARKLVAAPGGSHSLAGQAWFAEAHQRCHGPGSWMEIYADLTKLRNRIGEVAADRTSEVLQAVNMSNADRLVWSTGMDGRALRSEVFLRDQESESHYAMLTGKEVTDPQVTAAIPPEATKYAAFHFPVADAVRQLRDAYLRSRSPASQARLAEMWKRVEAQFGLDVEADFLDRLGDYLVLQNWPPHPLKIPFLGAIWIRYQGDRAEMVKTIDRLMQIWQAALNPPAASQPSTRTAVAMVSLLKPQLRRDESGMWFLQLGVAGPSIGVAEEWIVISYSREAVQANLAYLERRRQAASTPTSSPAGQCRPSVTPG